MFPDFDISSIIGGLDPSQWGSALAAAGVSPDALSAHADAAPMGGGTPSPWTGGGEAAPMGAMPLPASAPIVGGAAPAGGMPPPSPWEPEPQGSPAGPPVQAGEAPAAAPGAAPPAAGSPPSLVQALRGMVAPTVPQPQRVSTPSAPHAPGKIQGGDLIGLLGHLGMLRGAQMPTSYQLPSTLGAALGGH